MVSTDVLQTQRGGLGGPLKGDRNLNGERYSVVADRNLSRNVVATNWLQSERGECAVDKFLGFYRAFSHDCVSMYCLNYIRSSDQGAIYLWRVSVILAWSKRRYTSSEDVIFCLYLGDVTKLAFLSVLGLREPWGTLSKGLIYLGFPVFLMTGRGPYWWRALYVQKSRGWK